MKENREKKLEPKWKCTNSSYTQMTLTKYPGDESTERFSVEFRIEGATTYSKRQFSIARYLLGRACLCVRLLCHDGTFAGGVDVSVKMEAHK